MYGILASGYAEWPIIKQLAELLGIVMNLIFDFMDNVFGIQSIGISIIIFTIIVYTLMIPITIKQQKFSKMSTLMNPEIQKVQKKYEGKRDNVSIAKQQEELNMIYEKYGTSPTGGCLPMLIQFPLLFALYPVIQNIPKYVKSVRDVYTPLVNEIVASDAYQKIVAAIGAEKPVLMNPEDYDYSKAETLVNVFYKFQDATWTALSEKAPKLVEMINDVVESLAEMNSFLGINIGEAPMTIITTSFGAGAWGAIVVAAAIPILSALTQYLSVKMSQGKQDKSKKKSDDPMAQSMQTMTVMMPLMSLFLCFTLPAGLGLYWCTSAIVRTIQTIGINKYMEKIPLEDIIAENQEKAAKRREKDGVKAEELRRMATVKTNKKTKKLSEDEKEKEEMIQKATAHVLTAPKGTLAYKAASVNRYNTNQVEEIVVKEENK